VSISDAQRGPFRDLDLNWATSIRGADRLQQSLSADVTDSAVKRAVVRPLGVYGCGGRLPEKKALSWGPTVLAVELVCSAVLRHDTGRVHTAHDAALTVCTATGGLACAFANTDGAKLCVEHRDQRAPGRSPARRRTRRDRLPEISRFRAVTSLGPSVRSSATECETSFARTASPRGRSRMTTSRRS
jgi:hypothetical protein